MLEKDSVRAVKKLKGSDHTLFKNRAVEDFAIQESLNDDTSIKLEELQQAHLLSLERYHWFYVKLNSI